MIKEIENQFLEAKNESNIEIRLKKLKKIRAKLIAIIINPDISTLEKEEAFNIIKLMNFSLN